MWNEEFVFVINDGSSQLNADVKMKTALKDEFVGGVVIKASELLKYNFNEPWQKQYMMIDKSANMMDAVLHFEFMLEPVTLDFIRFRGDEALGHLVEPICDVVSLLLLYFSPSLLLSFCVSCAHVRTRTLYPFPLFLCVCVCFCADPIFLLQFLVKPVALVCD